MSEQSDLFGYRPDIDGLRAVAVLSVVVFHAGIGSFPGGFVGVDIFFVISGYLIGGHIFSEVRQGRFSFASFYARRVRRILPALFALLLITYAAAAMLLTPLELKELGKEAVPTIFGVSNFLFYKGGGYFAPAAEYNPLLMTWSLGVEEQFYVLFPFVMIALGRLQARAELLSLILLSLLSFGGSLLLMRVDPSAAFYLLPTRAWELGLGASLAVWERRRDFAPVGRPTSEILGIAGAVLVVCGLFLYRPTFPFPGWFVLLPTFGTTLVIAARGGIVNRLALSRGPAIFAGKVSYSWYLWHWPLFFLNRVLSSPVHPGFLILASFVLGVMSWRFVEQPFRRRVLSQNKALLNYAVAAVLVSLAALTFLLSDGWPQRLSPAARAYAEEAREARDSQCLAPYGVVAPQNMVQCLPALPINGERLLLLGDSHASSLAPGFAIAAKKAGLGFGEMTKSSCLPLWGFSRDLPERVAHWAQCRAYQDRAFAYVANHPEIRVVVLAGYWSSGMSVRGPQRRDTPLRVALDATITRLQALGRRVILVQDVPTFRFDPYARVVGSAIPARAWLSGASREIRQDRDRQVFADAARPVVAAIAREHRNVRLVDPAASLCNVAGCSYRDDKSLYYFDFQHLTRSGAIMATTDFSTATLATANAVGPSAPSVGRALP